MLGDRLRDGLAHKIRIAQVAGKHAAHPLNVALRQRLVGVPRLSLTRSIWSAEASMPSIEEAGSPGVR